LASDGNLAQLLPKLKKSQVQADEDTRKK
jgi:hypothetical protein